MRLEFVSDEGTYCFRPFTCCLGLLGVTNGVEVSHDDVFIMEVIKKMKVWREIGRTGGDKGM